MSQSPAFAISIKTPPSPKFRPGDLAIFDPSVAPNEGDFVATITPTGKFCISPFHQFCGKHPQGEFQGTMVELRRSRIGTRT